MSDINSMVNFYLSENILKKVKDDWKREDKATGKIRKAGLEQQANASYLKNAIRGGVGGLAGAHTGKYISQQMTGMKHPWSGKKTSAIGGLGGAALGAALTPLQRKMAKRRLEQMKDK